MNLKMKVMCFFRIKLFVITLLCMMACGHEIAMETHLVEPIELDGFSWSKPTWEKDFMNARRTGGGFMGPVKYAWSTRVEGDGKRWTGSMFWFNDMEYPSRTDRFLSFSQGVGFFAQKRDGSVCHFHNAIGFGFKFNDSLGIMSFNVDSMVQSHTTQNELKDTRFVIDSTFYNEMQEKFDDIQNLPVFMSTFRFTAPFTLSISNSRIKQKEPSVKIKQRPRDCFIELYEHEFKNDRILGKKEYSGWLNKYIYSDTMLTDISTDLYLKDTGNYNSHGFYVRSTYGTTDSMAEIHYKHNVKYVYDDMGFITDRQYFWEIGKRGKRSFYIYHEGNYSGVEFYDSTTYLNEKYIYDAHHRLDSHYFEKTFPDGDVFIGNYEVFYYSDLNAYPDSAFRVLKYRNSSHPRPSHFLTTVFDSDGKITEQRYYSSEKRKYLLHHYTVDYDDYDVFGNWKTRKIFYMEYQYNKPIWPDYRLMYIDYRKFDYYEED